MSARLHIVTASPSAVRTPVDGSPPPPAGAILADANGSARDDPRPVERRCVSTFRDGVGRHRPSGEGSVPTANFGTGPVDPSEAVGLSGDTSERTDASRSREGDSSACLPNPDPFVVALERLAVGWWLPCRWLDVWKAHR